MNQPYLSLEAELHDVFWAAEGEAVEVKLMESFLKKFPGKALEMGAGSGRLMFPLVQLGFDVEGLELSPDMLEIGRKSAVALGIDPVMHEGDMASWDNGQKYAALLAPAFTLQLASDAEKTLKHWHDLLKTGGGLYLTVFIPYAELLGDLPENEWYEDRRIVLEDGSEALMETRHLLDIERQSVEREHRYSIHGQVYRSMQSVRWFEHEELLNLLDECGFRLDRFYLDFDPNFRAEDPSETDFSGIITYEATQIC